MGRGTTRRVVEGAAAQPPLARRDPSVSRLRRLPPPRDELEEDLKAQLASHLLFASRTNSAISGGTRMIDNTTLASACPANSEPIGNSP